MPRVQIAHPLPPKERKKKFNLWTKLFPIFLVKIKKTNEKTNTAIKSISCSYINYKIFINLKFQMLYISQILIMQGQKYATAVFASLVMWLTCHPITTAMPEVYEGMATCIFCYDRGQPHYNSITTWWRVLLLSYFFCYINLALSPNVVPPQQDCLVGAAMCIAEKMKLSHMSSTAARPSH